MKEKAVIVKIGDTQDIDNEYTAAQAVKRCKGFVKFFCMFTCNDDFREFFKGRRMTICKGPGTSMKVIVMPYFPLGSIASYVWTPDNVGVLHSCLYTACLCYMDAYTEKGFIHNDFHAANILMKSTKERRMVFADGTTVELMGVRPWISDFEKSTIGTGSAMDYENFRYDIAKLFFLLPTFIDNIDRSSILNMPIFLQKADNICSTDSRAQLRGQIENSVLIHTRSALL